MVRPRHQRFIDEYLIDLDARQAAVRAGYAPRSAVEQSWALVRRPDIAAAIDEAMMARAKRTGISVELVLREYARLAFADARDVAHWGPGGSTLRDAAALSDEAAATIAELMTQPAEDGIAVRWRLFDKEAALGGMAQLLGLFEVPAGADKAAPAVAAPAGP